MKGRLPWKTQGRAAVPETERDAVDELRVGESGAMRCFELLLQIFALIVLAEEEVAFDALEVAVDVFHRCNTLHAVNGRHVTLSGDPRSFMAMQLFDVVVPIVQSGCQVRGCATGFTATNRPVVDDDDCAARAREQVRS